MTSSDTSFLKEIQDLPLLTAKREKELGTVIQKKKGSKKGESAITELVQHNLKLVAKEAFKYSHCSSVSLEELYNAGRVGLVRAVFKYNPIKFDTRFSTYATTWIRQGIREVIHGDSPVKVPLHIINGMFRKNRTLEDNVDISKEDMMKELDVTEAQMDKINKANVSSTSLNMPVGNGKFEGDATTYGDLIPDDKAEIPGDVGIDDPRSDFMFDALEELDDISKEIIVAQILDSDKTKLSDLGDKYGITGERVRQIKDKALRKLKKKIVYRMRINGHSAESIPNIDEKPKKVKNSKQKKVVPKSKAQLGTTWKMKKHGRVTVHTCNYKGKRVGDIRSTNSSRKVRTICGTSVKKSWDGTGKTIESLKDELMYLV